MKTNYCKIAALPLLIAALTAMFSCAKDTPTEEPSLTVSKSSAALVFSADGKTLTADGSSISPVFTVTTNQSSWDAKSDQTWLKLSKEGNQFVLSADANTDLNDVPAAKVTVTAGTAPAVVLYVTQETPSPEESEYATQSLILGRGYDVTGRYAYSLEVKSAVLDFTKLVRAGIVKRDGNIQKTEFYTCSGSTATEYTNSLAVHAGISTQAGVEGVGAFSSELTMNYSSSKTSKDAYSFATSTSRIAKDAWFVENRSDPASLQQHVSAAFLSDLESKTPEQIINKYGTHVMLGGIWGARFDYHFSAKKNIEAYTRDIGTSFSSKAEMSAKMITAAGGMDESIQNQYAGNYQSETEEIYALAYGGMPEYARNVRDSQDYDRWTESIEGHEIWCDYYPESLVPIYEFIADETIKSAVREACNSYLAGRKITVTTSLVNKGTSEWFELTGAIIVGGDGEIDSGSGKTTYWFLFMSLEKSGADIVVNFVYQVKEQGDRSSSHLSMEKSVSIPIYRNDFIITHAPLEWETGEQSLVGDLTDWVEMLWATPYFNANYWWLRLDAPGRNDNQYVGVKGYLYINYAVFEDE